MRPQDFLTPEEFACLKAACKDDRERAIVLTLAGTGMRVNELCNGYKDRRVFLDLDNKTGKDSALAALKEDTFM